MELTATGIVPDFLSPKNFSKDWSPDSLFIPSVLTTNANLTQHNGTVISDRCQPLNRFDGQTILELNIMYPWMKKPQYIGIDSLKLNFYIYAESSTSHQQINGDDHE